MSRVQTPEVSTGRSVFLVGGIALLLFLAKVLFIPIAFALIFSLLLVPAVTCLEKRRIPRPLSVALVTSLAFAAFFGGAYVLSRQVLEIAQTLPGYRANLQRKIAALHSSTDGSFRRALTTIEDMSEDLASSSASRENAMPVRVVDPGRGQLQAAGDLIAQISRPLGELGIVVVFTIYMLMKREELRHRLLLLAGMGRINLMTQALDDATVRISRYLLMQTAVNACYGILFGVGLFLIHVPNATLWGVIAGVLRIIPYVGTIGGVVLPLGVSIAVSSTWWTPLLVVVLFAIIELTAANFLEPWLYSSRTGISSLALLGSAIFWTMLWGWPGLVLSTPLTVCVVVLGRHVPQMGFLHSLLGRDAELSPAAHVYERLLAMDQIEATAIAERYLKGKPLVDLYDSVLIPALSLAEEDRHKGALDEVHSNFILLSIGELVARLSGYRQEGTVHDETPSRSIQIGQLGAPTHQEFAVVCISAGDKADELTTQMLTQLTELAGHQSLLLSADAVSDDVMIGLAAEKNTVIFISALPPFAFAQARTMCQRVRTRLPENRIAVALWNSKESPEEMLDRFGPAQPDIVAVKLAQAIGQLTHWQRNTRPML